MNAEELAEIREGSWGRAGSSQESMVRKLFYHIDALTAQITILKATLVCDRAALVTINMLDGILPESLPKSDDWCNVRGHSVDDRKHMAEIQLAQEYPELFGEDAQ
ncbi:MAG: hypothetical protein WC124_02165 [Desulfoplanes sp.]